MTGSDLGSLLPPGPEVERLLRIFEADHGLVSEEERLRKVEEAQRILSHGPSVTGRSAVGLALGYVQSGKTMSFTTLAALAHDNGYRVVILVLGNTHLLVGQNTDRLLADLRIAERDDWAWVHLSMPKSDADLDFYLAQDKRVVVVTVLKHAKRLNHVAGMLEASNLVRSADVLIVDDEADQASLNAGARAGKTTPTYRAIQRLRAAAPRHLYVQYTATAFAPLLLEPHDDLAPEFVEILRPGAGYTGGPAFFLEHRDAIVRTIPDAEAEDKEPARMPGGLRDAANTFLVSSALLKASGNLPGSVSMLVHTSGLKVDHSVIAGYMRAFLEPLRTKVGLSKADVGRRQLMSSMAAYREDLVRHGAQDVPDADFEDALEWCIKMAIIWVVNSGEDGRQPDWSMSPINILIGGNKLDRGFTVKGLTTTYMTRRAANGQADTVEQRARCYGYKAGYIRYCRVFAPANVIDAFTSLVHTEADLRDSLESWIAAGKPLKDWSATEGILLPDDLRPTRPTVLRNPYQRELSGWSFLRHPDLDAGAADHNRGLLRQFDLTTGEIREFGEVRATILHAIDSEQIVDLLLEPWQVTASPGWDGTTLSRAIRANARAGLLPHMALVLLERLGKDGQPRPRERAWAEPGGFVNLMQGRNAGTRYPGDRRLLDDQAQVQVHRVQRAGMSEDLLTLAVYLPSLRGGLARAARRR